MNNIDLVVLWVDGNDPAWQAQKASVTQSGGDNRAIRYRDWGLMKYWFRAVEKNLPFINKVHFITWGHLPPWLNTEHPKLNIVKHSDYIPEEYLPTFNSNVIELNLHRLQGLSEHFILANDDFFFLAPKTKEFFFKGGLPVDAAVQNVLQFHKSGGIGHIMANNLEVLNQSFNKRSVMKKMPSKWFNIRYGVKILYNLYLLPLSNFTGFNDPHIPYSYLKSTWNELWEERGDLLDKVCRNKIRSNEDINHWLMRYRQFAKGDFYPANPDRGEFFIIGQDDEKIAQAIKNQNTPMICISDDFDNIDYEKEQAFLENLFKEVFPNKSEYEI
ncbi:MAG: Stealth CR1 domain-containing protein [Clostridia bacterium]|nr:Stealth CR1 domain-containing protein [Clostridia bacterium]